MRRLFFGSSLSLDPGVWSGQNADWWVAAYTPYDSTPELVYLCLPRGLAGRHSGRVQMLLFGLLGPLNVLNMVLPVGDYTFYFALTVIWTENLTQPGWTQSRYMWSKTVPLFTLAHLAPTFLKSA